MHELLETIGYVPLTEPHSQALPCTNEKSGNTGRACHVRNVASRENLTVCGQGKLQFMYYFIPMCVGPSRECCMAYSVITLSCSVEQSYYHAQTPELHQLLVETSRQPFNSLAEN